MPKAKTRASAATIHAVVGSDEAEVKRVAAELAEKISPPEAGDFGLEIIDGVAENADQAAARIRSTIDALQTLPFFGSSKVVWLKSANFLGDTQISRAASVQSALEELSDLIENGLGSDDTFLDGERRVKVDQVRELVPLSRAGVIFELSGALAARDLELAFTLVRRLLDQGESAIGILLVAILPTIRNLLLAKDLMEHYRLSRPHAPFPFISAINRLPADAIAHLPRKKDGMVNAYALGIAAQNAHRFSTEQLIAGMQACLAGNLQLVTTQLDHELILTEVVVKLLATNNVGAASAPR